MDQRTDYHSVQPAVTIPTAPMQYQWHSDSWCPAGTATPPPPPLGTLALPAPQCQPRRHGDTGATTSELFSLWRHSPLAASTKRPPAQAAMQCQGLPSAAGRCTNGPLCHALAAPLPLPVLMRVTGASLGHFTNWKELHSDRSRPILSEEWRAGGGAGTQQQRGTHAHRTAINS